MSIHRVYAMIDGSGNVCNVSKFDAPFDNYEDANRIARAVYGDDAIAVDCSQYYCTSGDIFRDNRFYRISDDGTEMEIEYVPTEEQQIQMLNGQNTELQLALAEQYEVNLSLQDEVTNTQIALADLFEGKEV